jgi:hypothetical protein
MYVKSLLCTPLDVTRNIEYIDGCMVYVSSVRMHFTSNENEAVHSGKIN